MGSGPETTDRRARPSPWPTPDPLELTGERIHEERRSNTQPGTSSTDYGAIGRVAEGSRALSEEISKGVRSTAPRRAAEQAGIATSRPTTTNWMADRIGMWWWRMASGATGFLVVSRRPAVLVIATEPGHPPPIMGGDENRRAASAEEGEDEDAAC